MREYLCQAESCGAPANKGWAVCRTCAATLERDLAQIPALQTELDTQTARTASRTGNGTRTAVEPPLPYDPRAAERTWLLRNTLVGWVRDLEPDTGRHPHDTLTGMAHWLLTRHGALLVHPAGGEAVSEIGYAVAQAWRAVDNPAERVFLGSCPCGADLFAPTDATAVHCRDCDTEHDPADLRDGLTSKLAGHLVTGVEFAGYAVRYLGVNPRAQERLEASVRTWASRGRVEAIGHAPRPDGPAQPTYRFGDLAAKLSERSA